MSDFEERNFNTGFQGLVNTSAIFAGVGGAAIVGYEVLRQLRRLPRVQFVKFWKEKRRDREGQGGVDGGLDEEASGHGSGHGVGIGTRSKLTCEDWEMGHLYQARMFHATTPSPPLSRWPFGWVKQAINFTDQFYAEHTGMDTVVYVRFLRACFGWTLLHTLTTAPILLTIHIKYSRGVAATDMSRASLSYLVTVPGPGCADISDQDCSREPNEQGRSLLWIHLSLLWYVTVTWLYTLYWIGKGALKVRRGLIDKTRQRVQEALNKARDGTSGPGGEEASVRPSVAMRSAQGLPADTSDGWRHRTLMVMNLPPTMRDEASIRRYFEEFLRPDDASLVSVESRLGGDAPSEAVHPVGGERGGVSLEGNSSDGGTSRKALISGTTDGSTGRAHDAVPEMSPRGPEPDLHPDRHLKSPVQTVVLVRKMNELSSMLGRRQEVLNQLEAAHIKLAQNVMATVARRTLKLRRRARREAEQAQADDLAAEQGRPTRKRSHGAVAAVSGLLGRLRRLGRAKSRQRSRNDDALDGDEFASGKQTLDQLEFDLEKMPSIQLTDEARAKVDDLARRLARFSPANAGLHGRETQLIGDRQEAEENEFHETVWEALAALPRELLDPYQPVTRLSALFRGQTVPTIDYLLTKLNLLTALVTEMRSRPPTSYEPTSTAFVTFRDPRQARMVWRELKSQIVVKVRLAPEVKDLDWERLMRTSFTGDLVRGLGVNMGFWTFTIFWVIIINIITNTLFSVQSFKKVLPGVRDFFDNHKSFEAFLSITLPTVIVSLITMSVPELIFQTSKRAQGFVTFSALYDMCLVRYWKFVICNVVIFFCVGVTTVKAILSQVDESGKILDNIAFSFPTAAPFFVSYMILQLALQSGFEHVGFMIALLQHLGARKAVTPRTRALKTLPRNFNRYYWLPLHINIMAIQFIFAVLNPLILPFALIYMAVALVVFKKNFAYHYYRRFNEMQGVVYYTRILRYSIDSLLVMQAVLLIFFSVTHQGSVYIGMTAVLIPLTVIIKLLATRLWKSQCRAVEDEEAEAVCGIDSRPSRWGEKQDRDYGAVAHDDALDSRSPLDARASGRYPAIIPPPQTGSSFHRAWQRIHDSFNANGLDKPSYLASAQAKGQRIHNPLEIGAKTLAKTPEHFFRKTAAQGKHLTSAAKQTLGMDSKAGDSRSSFDHRERARSFDRETRARPTSGVSKNGTTISFGQETDDAWREDARDAALKDVQRAKAISKRRKGSYGRSRVYGLGLLRGNSVKSEERPFLSGYDAISAHAPVASEHDPELSYADGDEPYWELNGEIARSRSIKRNASRRLAYSHSTLRSRRAPPPLVEEQSSEARELAIREVSEFGGSQHTDAIARKMADEARRHEGAEASGGSRSKDAYAREGHTSEEDGGEDYDDDDEDDFDGSEVLVRPHAPVRWDDTPNYTARYNNPFYNRELDPYLWLPRDPLAPLDLCDTIEWHGPALVSSQGGPGHVGEWDDEDDEDDDEDEYDGFNHEGVHGFRADGDHDHDDDGIRLGGEACEQRLTHRDRLDGNEEIIVSSTLARHLEQMQDVDEAPDPAASLPKNLMEDFKKALQNSEKSDVGDAASSRLSSEDTYMAGRRRSMVSGGNESFKSPTLSARILADERFAGLEPLDLSPATLRQGQGLNADYLTPRSAGPLTGLQIPQRRNSGHSNLRMSPGSSPNDTRSISFDPRDPLAAMLAEGSGDTGEPEEFVASDDHSTMMMAAPMTPRRPMSRSYSVATSSGQRPGTIYSTSSNATESSRRRMTRSSSGIPFGSAADSTIDEPEHAKSSRQRRASRPGASQQRRRGSIAYGHGDRAASMASTNANRVVTLRAALKAEALEEERRFTLKERLTKRSQKSKGSGDKNGDNEDATCGNEEVGEGGSTVRNKSSLHRAGTIMARYEARQQRRREKNASEFGIPGDINESPKDDGVSRVDYIFTPSTQQGDGSTLSWMKSPRDSTNGASRFKIAALGALSLARAHTTATGRQSNNKAPTSSAAERQAERLAQARNQWNQRHDAASTLQMQELRRDAAPSIASSTESPGQQQQQQAAATATGGSEAVEQGDGEQLLDTGTATAPAPKLTLNNGSSLYDPDESLGSEEGRRTPRQGD
ncbi:hypothetical protein ACQY0O_005707 [Thecaphora frezii]